jgi:hypothetical protein
MGTENLPSQLQLPFFFLKFPVPHLSLLPFHAQSGTFIAAAQNVNLEAAAKKP